MNSVKPPDAATAPARPQPQATEASDEATTCPRCGESHDLAKVKGCIKCLKCGFKFDCNGW
jgi:ribosomal protein S27AE